jgi:hypothetical protein
MPHAVVQKAEAEVEGMVFAKDVEEQVDDDPNSIGNQMSNINSRITDITAKYNDDGDNQEEFLYFEQTSIIRNKLIDSLADLDVQSLHRSEVIEALHRAFEGLKQGAHDINQDAVEDEMVISVTDGLLADTTDSATDMRTKADASALKLNGVFKKVMAVFADVIADILSKDKTTGRPKPVPSADAGDDAGGRRSSASGVMENIGAKAIEMEMRLTVAEANSTAQADETRENMEVWKSSVVEYEDRINFLEKQIARQERENRVREQQSRNAGMDAMFKASQEAKGKDGELQAEIDELKEQVKGLEGQLDDARARAGKMDGANRDLEIKMRQIEAELRKAKQLANAEASAAEIAKQEEIAKLKALHADEIDKLKEELRALAQAREDDKKEAAAAHKAALEALEQKFKDASGDGADTMRKLEAAEAKIERLEEALAKVKKEKDDLQAKLAEEKERREALAKELSDVKSDFADQLKKAKSEAGAADAAAASSAAKAAADAEAERLRKLLADMEARANKAEADLAQQRARAAEAEAAAAARASDLEKQLQKMQVQLQSAGGDDAALQAAQARVTELEEQLASAAQAHQAAEDGLNSQISSLTAQIGSLTEQCASVQAALDFAREQAAGHAGEKAQLQAKIDELAAQLAAASSELDAAKESLQKLEAELQEAKDAEAAAAQKLLEAQDAAAAEALRLQGEMEALKAGLGDADAQALADAAARAAAEAEAAEAARQAALSDAEKAAQDAATAAAAEAAAKAQADAAAEMATQQAVAAADGATSGAVAAATAAADQAERAAISAQEKKDADDRMAASAGASADDLRRMAEQLAKEKDQLKAQMQQQIEDLRREFELEKERLSGQFEQEKQDALSAFEAMKEKMLAEQERLLQQMKAIEDEHEEGTKRLQQAAAENEVFRRQVSELQSLLFRVEQQLERINDSKIISMIQEDEGIQSADSDVAKMIQESTQARRQSMVVQQGLSKRRFSTAPQGRRFSGNIQVNPADKGLRRVSVVEPGKYQSALPSAEDLEAAFGAMTLPDLPDLEFAALPLDDEVQLDDVLVKPGSPEHAARFAEVAASRAVVAQGNAEAAVVFKENMEKVADSASTQVQLAASDETAANVIRARRASADDTRAVVKLATKNSLLHTRMATIQKQQADLQLALAQKSKRAVSSAEEHQKQLDQLPRALIDPVEDSDGKVPMEWVFASPEYDHESKFSEQVASVQAQKEELVAAVRASEDAPLDGITDANVLGELNAAAEHKKAVLSDQHSGAQLAALDYLSTVVSRAREEEEVLSKRLRDARNDVTEAEHAERAEWDGKDVSFATSKATKHAAEREVAEAQVVSQSTVVAALKLQMALANDQDGGTDEDMVDAIRRDQTRAEQALVAGEKQLSGAQKKEITNAKALIALAETEQVGDLAQVADIQRKLTMAEHSEKRCELRKLATGSVVLMSSRHAAVQGRKDILEQKLAAAAVEEQVFERNAANCAELRDRLASELSSNQTLGPREQNVAQAADVELEKEHQHLLSNVVRAAKSQVQLRVQLNEVDGMLQEDTEMQTQLKQAALTCQILESDASVTAQKIEFPDQDVTLDELAQRHEAAKMGTMHDAAALMNAIGAMEVITVNIAERHIQLDLGLPAAEPVPTDLKISKQVVASARQTAQDTATVVGIQQQIARLKQEAAGVSDDIQLNADATRDAHAAALDSQIMVIHEIEIDGADENDYFPAVPTDSSSAGAAVGTSAAMLSEISKQIQFVDEIHSNALTPEVQDRMGRRKSFLANQATQLTATIQECGGWKKALYLQNGEVDVNMDLQPWTIDEQIQILLETKQYLIETSDKDRESLTAEKDKFLQLLMEERDKINALKAVHETALTEQGSSAAVSVGGEVLGGAMSLINGICGSGGLVQTLASACAPHLPKGKEKGALSAKTLSQEVTGSANTLLLDLPEKPAADGGSKGLVNACDGIGTLLPNAANLVQVTFDNFVSKTTDLQVQYTGAEERYKKALADQQEAERWNAQLKQQIEALKVEAAKPPTPPAANGSDGGVGGDDEVFATTVPGLTDQLARSREATKRAQAEVERSRLQAIHADMKREQLEIAAKASNMNVDAINDASRKAQQAEDEAAERIRVLQLQVDEANQVIERAEINKMELVNREKALAAQYAALGDEKRQLELRLMELQRQLAQEKIAPRVRLQLEQVKGEVDKSLADVNRKMLMIRLQQERAVMAVVQAQRHDFVGSTHKSSYVNVNGNPYENIVDYVEQSSLKVEGQVYESKSARALSLSTGTPPKRRPPGAVLPMSQPKKPMEPLQGQTMEFKGKGDGRSAGERWGPAKVGSVHTKLYFEENPGQARGPGIEMDVDEKLKLEKESQVLVANIEGLASTVAVDDGRSLDDGLRGEGDYTALFEEKLREEQRTLRKASANYLDASAMGLPSSPGGPATGGGGPAGTTKARGETCRNADDLLLDC